MTAPRLAPTSRARAPHLTAAQLDQLRRQLAELLREQERAAAEHHAAAADLALPGDREAGFARELAEGLAARAQETIEAIEHALAAIDAGTYGYCRTCGDAIPFERLEALPHGAVCLACTTPRRGLLAR